MTADIQQTIHMERISFASPHGPKVCCGCWDLMVDIVTQRAVWQCNECGEMRDVQPPGETLKRSTLVDHI